MPYYLTPEKDDYDQIPSRLSSVRLWPVVAFH